MAPSQTAPNRGHSPAISPKRPLWKRIYLTIKLRLVQGVVITLLKLSDLAFIRDKKIQPTFTKVYPCQPTLTNRVFIPKSYKSDDPLLPLYLDIHGGGFAIGMPLIDDPFCSSFANDNKIIVMSLDYPKAPTHRYPAAVNALTDVIKAVLEDATLPFDKKRVAIGGFSAGANLSLAVTQNKILRDQIGAVVAYYPPCDFVTKGPEKMKTRQLGAPPDPLENVVSMFDYGYAPTGHNLRDPLLSVRFAKREELPPKLCIIGCEFDLLCREAELFAEKMASVGNSERTGTDILWEKNGVRWEKVLGELHGFDAMISFGDTKIRVTKRKKEMYDSAAQWLFREVYV